MGEHFRPSNLFSYVLRSVQLLSISYVNAYIPVRILLTTLGFTDALIPNTIGIVYVICHNEVGLCQVRLNVTEIRTKRTSGSTNNSKFRIHNSVNVGENCCVHVQEILNLPLNSSNTMMNCNKE